MKRVLLAIVGIGALVVGAWIITLVGLLVFSGVSTVSVETVDGPDIAFPVPMAVVEAAAWTAPRFVESELEEVAIHADLGDVAPIVLSIAEMIDDLPNGTFVEVEDGEDHVVVGQRRGRLTIEVETDDAQIHIAVPKRSVVRLLRHLGHGIDKERPVFATPTLL